MLRFVAVNTYNAIGISHGNSFFFDLAKKFNRYCIKLIINRGWQQYIIQIPLLKHIYKNIIILKRMSSMICLNDVYICKTQYKTIQSAYYSFFNR